MKKPKRRNKPHFQFYKDKYLICVYDNEGKLLDVFDNPREMAEAYGKTIDNIYHLLWRLKTGVIKKSHLGIIELVEYNESEDF